MAVVNFLQARQVLKLFEKICAHGTDQKQRAFRILQCIGQQFIKLVARSIACKGKKLFKLIDDEQKSGLFALACSCRGCGEVAVKHLEVSSECVVSEFLSSGPFGLSHLVPVPRSFAPTRLLLVPHPFGLALEIHLGSVGPRPIRPTPLGQVPGPFRPFI